MERPAETASTFRHYSPLAQLFLARTRELYRQPGRIFWAYGLPILLTMGLGIAFRNQGIPQIRVDVVEGSAADHIAQSLPAPRYKATIAELQTCRRNLRIGRADLVVAPSSTGKDYEYWFDPMRRESVLARNQVDDALQRAAGRKDPVPVTEDGVTEPGSRYIDFIVPGLLAASLMGGGLYGVAFVSVDMRMRHLLKRFLVTPMRKSDFLLGIILSRYAFKISEIALLLLFAYYAFGVGIQGTFWAFAVLILIGAFTFSAIGLLVGSRARTMESASGLINAVMLPMWVLSGIFFSSDRFPAVTQPVIKALPLTALVDAVRSVMLEGTPLRALWLQVAILVAWGIATFTLALRWFRWM